MFQTSFISDCRTKKPSKTDTPQGHRAWAPKALLAEAHLPAEGPDLGEEEAVGPFQWKLHGEMTEENDDIFREKHRKIREHPL